MKTCWRRTDMTITQTAAAKLGKHVYDLFETEMLIKIERRLEQIAKEKKIQLPEHIPTDEQCAKQESCLMCEYRAECDRDFKEQREGEDSELPPYK